VLQQEGLTEGIMFRGWGKRGKMGALKNKEKGNLARGRGLSGGGFSGDEQRTAAGAIISLEAPREVYIKRGYRGSRKGALKI